MELPAGPWPLADRADTSIPLVRALDPESSGAKMLLNQGQWTYAADTRDLAATVSGLLSFVVHDNEWPDAIRLLSQPQARTSEGTPLDARNTDRNQNVWHAKLDLATTGLHLAQFRHKHRPLAKAVDYAEIFIYDKAQQEAALSDLAILGALPRKCLFFA